MGQDSSQTGQADYYLAQVSSASLYYPFGWEMPGRKFVSGEGYRFGFNGQEEDPDIHGGGIVFKYRTEDARVARFFAVDPIAAQYPELTPYQVASNSPIYLIEVEGLEGELSQEGKKYQNQQKGRTLIIVAGGNYIDGTVGHTYLEVDGTVYTYGRYADLDDSSGKDDPSSAGGVTAKSGEGVLIKKEGIEAKEFNKKYVNKYGAKVFEVEGANSGKIKDHFEDQLKSGSNPTEGKYKDKGNAKTVDKYKLYSNNCTTKTCEGVAKGIPESATSTTTESAGYGRTVYFSDKRNLNRKIKEQKTPNALLGYLKKDKKTTGVNIEDVTVEYEGK
ncbi:hypothetical protein SapgrDRAFT_0250 [Saprospira grandis DSM 2844]|uniref:RHS repeat-associated core domain protein n=1 Tax=Saprospira grandis DSM 2844 TaxID=694433 RepID=J1I163_9BACT|nr:hypothetical protein [Saprospira grandis]EJF52003.1 hypothetical protein SapgrDRAFT_0250 [Saprospira grandis DSM 2844]